jgi:hypothetical protein
MDNYYSKFSGLIDSVYHVIDAHYDFKIKKDLSFKRNVSSKLKTKNLKLYDYLEALKENKVYKSTNLFRNNLMHNYRPNQIDSGLKYSIEDGKTTIALTIGNYTTTSEFVTNIEESIDLLGELVEFVADALSVE